MPISVISQDSEKPGDKGGIAGAVSPWTEADTRLANHYIQLLQKDPAYGKVLDLLWDVYDKKSQTSLLLDYFKGASVSGPTVARLIYAHLLRKSDQIEEARPIYDQVLEVEPGNLPALKALAEIADQQKRTTDIAVDAEHVYWLTKRTVMRVAKAAYTPSLRQALRWRATTRRPWRWPTS